MSSNEIMELWEAAVHKDRDGPWDKGDILLKGFPMGDNKDKKYREECRLFLNSFIPINKANGLRYSIGRLREFRTISHLYPADRRRADVGYEVHVVARDPDTLDFLIKTLPPGQELTKRYAKQQIKGIHEIKRAKWREIHGLEPIPVSTSSLPAADFQSFALSLKLLNNAKLSLKLAKDTEQMLGQGPHDSADNALFDAAMRTHKAWLDIVNKMRGIRESKSNKRPRLSAVI